jgi:glyoxylase-like metal-dependent hydrolase (beta-lactamase superfamily II)
VSAADIRVVVNCHLHFDHCGGNRDLPHAPILVQRAELALARGGDYTFDALVDFAGATYRELDGEAEVWPGVHVLPTPGHTEGHQSLAVRQPDGTLILAGQTHPSAAGYGADVLARRAAQDGASPPLPGYEPWLDRILEFDPRRVLFAHDNSVWEPA